MTALPRLDCSQQNLCPDPVLEFGGQPSYSEQLESRPPEEVCGLLNPLPAVLVSGLEGGSLASK